MVYVSRNDPGYAEAKERSLRGSTPPLTALYSPRHGGLHTPNSDRLSLAPTVRGAEGNRSLPSAGGSRPMTAGEMSASASLPSLIPLGAPGGKMSPYTEDLKAQRDAKALRQRNKELEGELRRTTQALQKTRQLNQMQSAYGKQAPEHAWDASGTPSPAKLPPGIVDAETFSRAKREWEAELQRVKAACDQRIRSTNMQHQEELKQLRASSGSKEEEAAAREAAAREERVELLKRQIGRRMMNRQISMGFTAWVDMWEAKVYAMSRLRECGQRLKSPELAEAFGEWVAVWDEAVREREEAEAAEREKLLRGESVTLEEEVERLKLALAAAEDEKEKALERQMVELAGSAEERMALQAEKEKEERIELLKRQVGRRMMNQGIANGWQAWYELWEAKTYAMERLCEVGNRFRAPELSNAFSFWMADWQDAKHEEEKADLERQSKTLEAQLRAARFEVGQMSMTKIAYEDEITSLKEKVTELTDAMKDRSTGAAVVEALKKQLEELSMSQAQAEAEAEVAEQKRQDAEKDAAKQHAEDKKLLEKLLAEQRKGFEAELSTFRAEVEGEKDAKAKEERVELLRRQVGRRMMHRHLTRGWTAWDDYVTAKVYALNRLREVGNRFRAPELSAAFSWWVRLHTFQREKRLKTDAQKKIEMLGKDAEKAVNIEAELDRVRGELDAVMTQRDELRQTLSAIDGGVAEAERQREEQMAREKQERVELLTRQVGRRMMNQGITRGFTAWLELWEAKTYAMNRLREVGNRFRSPELSNAFASWGRHVDAIHQAKMELEFNHKAVALASESGKAAELEEKLKAALKEIETIKSERTDLREKLAKLDGGAAEAERMYQEQMEKEKEARVELLKRQVGRRMMNQGIANGWAAWYELWEAKTYAMNRLREVGNRFRSPELAVAFSNWEGYVDVIHQARAVAQIRKQAGGLANEASGMKSELEQLRADMNAKLAAAEADKRQALQRQMVELTGSAEAQLAMKEEREKEERVELLRRQIGRRMLNQGITRGFSAWHEMWSAKVYAMQRLREVGNRFRSPALLVAFEEWAETCYQTKQAAKLAAAEAHKAKLEEERMELNGEIAKVKAEYEEKLRKAEASRVLLLEKVALLGGGGVEAQELLEAQAALDKEKRVEMLRRQIARRMLNQGIIRGWTAWQELWRARKEALTVLRLVGNRFRAPAVAVAFANWVEEWELIVQQAADKRRLAELRGESAALQGEQMTLHEQLEQVKIEMRAKLQAAEEDKQRALARQLTELAGSAEERAVLLEQKAKEERVELLRRQVMRRMMNQGIANGWAAWYELWTAKTYAMERLREVGNKFKAPELSNAFGFWADDVAEGKRQKHLMAIENQSKSLEAQLRQARFEVGQVNLVKVANADEIASMKEKIYELGNEVQDREARVAVLRGYEREAEELRLTQQSALEAQKLAEVKRVEAEADAMKQREADKELLERLLAEQRKQFEDEQEAAKKRLKAQADERKAYEDQITKLATDMTVQKTTAEKTEAMMKGDADKMKAEIEKLKADIVKLKKPPPVKVKKDVPKVKPSPLGTFDLDEGPDAPPISQQLATALKKNSARVLDLFRSWDADGDGEVSRAEFHRAMPALGLEVPKKDIDDLFSEWDKDGGGALGLRELQKILSTANRAPAKGAEKVQEVVSTSMTTLSAMSAFGKLGKKSPATPSLNPTKE